MAVATGTGLGGTVSALGLTGLTIANWSIQSISGYGEAVAILDDTSLSSSTFEESIPASLASIEEITISCYWEYGEEALFAGGVMLVGDVGTFTITMPTRTGLTTPGTISGTAFITGMRAPDHTAGERSIGTFTLKFDGKTGPTYTQSS